MNSNIFFSCVLYVNIYCSQFLLRNAVLKRVAFVFNKSLSLSIAVILTPYLLKRMERVTISVYCDLLFFSISGEVPYDSKTPKTICCDKATCILVFLHCHVSTMLKGPCQPHLCFCLHTRIWLLYFICSTLKRRKSLSNY